MDKSADAFRTISEVAQDLDLPQHVLRFWESKFPQVKPLKRAGGRRYYRPADLDLLRSIRRLLYDDGYTIKGVQRLLKERGTKNLDQSEAGQSVGFEVGPSAEGAMRIETALGGEAPGPERPVQRDSFAQHPAFGDLVALRSALTSIEECERILAAVRAPSP